MTLPISLSTIYFLNMICSLEMSVSSKLHGLSLEFIISYYVVHSACIACAIHPSIHPSIIHYTYGKLVDGWMYGGWSMWRYFIWKAPSYLFLFLLCAVSNLLLLTDSARLEYGYVQ